MQLIADSGSSKTDWCLVGSDGVVLSTGQSMGLNPQVLSWQSIAAEVTQEVLPGLQAVGAASLDAVHFYGAGLADEHLCKQMEETLAANLGVKTVRAHHDILGAARAVAGTQAAIVCIMGTGSNSCLYDGNSVLHTKGGHGHLLGDEGGGVDMGRRLFQLLLNGRAGQELQRRFQRAYPSPLRILRNEIYQSERPNATLAAYAPFVRSNLDLPELAELVQQSFHDFLQNTVLQYEACPHLPLMCIGSVAHHFRAELSAACHAHQLQLHTVLQKPMTGLVQYHLSN